MERIHRLARARPQADVKAIVGIRHRGPVIEPELRIGLAEPDRVGTHDQLGMAERGEHLLVHGSARRKIAHRNGDVVDHAACPHAGAADLTSLYMIESIRAWNEARSEERRVGKEWRYR